MNKLYFSVLCSFFLIILQAPAFAQPASQNKVTLKTEFDHLFNSGIRGTDSRVSSSRFGFEGTYSYFTLAYDYTDYSWDRAGDSGLSPTGRTPWTGLHRVSLRARKNFFLNQEWMFNLGGAIGSYFEKEMSDSFALRADFSFIRIFNNGWSAGFGAGGVYHPVTSRVLPLITIGYAPTGDQGLSARIGFPETNVRYGFNENLAAKAYLGYTARIYRLRNNSPVQEKGYFRDQGLRFGLEMELRPVQSMSVSFGPYYVLERKWRVYDKNEKRVLKQKLKNSPGILMNLSWKF
jgi:opacity protein-like surface antigen